MKKHEWLSRMADAKTISDVLAIAREHGDKPYTLAPRYDYSMGPMYHFGQRVCVAMVRIGQPTIIHTCFRSPDEQRGLPSGVTNAEPWESPHQFYEAVDLIHKERGWPPASDPYWATLNDVAQVVAHEMGLPIVGGFEDWGWDFAHFEHQHWRSWAKELKRRGGYWRAPDEKERLERFAEVFPKLRDRLPRDQDQALRDFNLFTVSRDRLRKARDLLRDFF